MTRVVVISLFSLVQLPLHFGIRNINEAELVIANTFEFGIRCWVAYSTEYVIDFECTIFEKI